MDVAGSAAPRVAIAHDYVTQRGGAERVVLALLRAFPDAPLFTTFYEPASTFADYADYDVRTRPINRVTALRRDPRRALPVLAATVSRIHIDRSVADVVVCSTSGWAHGVHADGIPKVVYCHNPPRWLHQRDEYVADLPPAARVPLAALHRPLMSWDARAARSAARYVANSSVVRDRIARVYGIEADVVPPPVTIDTAGSLEPVPGIEPGFLLTVSRRRGYKNAQVVRSAVEKLDGPRLVIVGGVPDDEDAAGRVKAVSGLPDAQLRWLYANSLGLVAVSYEDFGLTPLEANAFGKPVLALRAGGYLDTVDEGVSGIFVDEANPLEVIAGIDQLISHSWDADAIRAHADRFSFDVFASRMRAIVGEVMTCT